ncbi:TPA: DUF4406 domain-containing protein [Salmonella enterica]|nr:DUF4406 domain-containing protein [Salmonella enterica]HAK2582646.1 DUF4406 domain-containing protein [Salmonella enterica]
MRGLFHIQDSPVKVYIAGPMSGLPNFNRDRFNEIAALVVESGNIPLNPATLIKVTQYGLTTPFTFRFTYLINGLYLSSNLKKSHAAPQALQHISVFTFQVMNNPGDNGITVFVCWSPRSLFIMNEKLPALIGNTKRKVDKIFITFPNLVFALT